MGFTVWSGDEQREVRKCVRAADDASSIVMTLARRAPLGAVVWHGRGLIPACNLADSARFPAPIFGPVEIGGTDA